MYWSFLSDSFISLEKKEEPPVCVACNTVKRILIECADLVEGGKIYSEERSLYTLFQNENPENICDYLEEIGMFYKV